MLGPPGLLRDIVLVAMPEGPNQGWNIAVVRWHSNPTSVTLLKKFLGVNTTHPCVMLTNEQGESFILGHLTSENYGSSRELPRDPLLPAQGHHLVIAPARGPLPTTEELLSVLEGLEPVKDPSQGTPFLRRQVLPAHLNSPAVRSMIEAMVLERKDMRASQERTWDPHSWDALTLDQTDLVP